MLFSVVVLSSTLGTTTTARAFSLNAEVFDGVTARVLVPALVGLIFVVIPAMLAVRASRRRLSLSVAIAAISVTAVALLTWSAAPGVNSALLFGRNSLPAPGLDGIVGTVDDARPFQWLAWVLVWPAVQMLIHALRRVWHERMTA